ncbi:Fic family protein [Treponema medium]|uniref:Fic family protein n=1 Tax=Treponema medium TaxID=58231 RepID=UPI0019803D83|nr:Fic family protein [Treponema medium]QSH91996.1 Fic family protein [Treponema medium]
MPYEPPFKITSKAINFISQISEKIGEIHNLENTVHSVQLRKKNRIKTIHSSLAIENNSLTIEQMTAIIEGKRVLGSPNEIWEVKNAVQAYELLLTLNPYQEKDLLQAHRLMMNELVNRSGKYRRDGVGIFDGRSVVHIAPPADRVPFLMDDLFQWLKDTDAHPLIKSSVFHYEFEFIHPFEDGNGRMGRLWHSRILAEWNPLFIHLPIETLIKEHQTEYYHALGISDANSDSTAFIEFMLSMIFDTIESILATESKITQKITQKITVNQQKIIQAIKDNPYITQEELAGIVGIARLNIIKNMKKLQEQHIITRVGADKNGYWHIEENN